jgi:transposase
MDYAEHRTPIQTQEMLETAKMRPPVCRSLVFKWHKRFRDGPEDIEDDKGRGRKSTLTAASIKEVKDVIDWDRRYTVRDVCDITCLVTIILCLKKMIFKN